MAINLIINGISFDYPETGDEGWGFEATDWAQAVSNSTLQKSAGLFTLSSDVDFGSIAGILSKFYSSRNANPADAGVLRLTSSDTIEWRNTANTANNTLGHTNNILEWNGDDVITRTTLTAETDLYVLLDGSRPMTGTLVIGDGVSGRSLIIRESGGDQSIRFRNAASINTTSFVEDNVAGEFLIIKQDAVTSAALTTLTLYEDGNIGIVGGANIPTDDSHLVRLDYLDNFVTNPMTSNLDTAGWIIKTIDKTTAGSAKRILLYGGAQSYAGGGSDAGHVLITAGEGTNNNNGGRIDLFSGDADGATAAGGDINIKAGRGTNGSDAGDINITAGFTATGTTGVSGTVTIKGGNGTGTSAAGDVYISGGGALFGLDGGKVIIEPGADPLGNGAIEIHGPAGQTLNAEIDFYKDTNGAHTTGPKVAFGVPQTLLADAEFYLPINNGSLGYILRTDGSGNTSWVLNTGGITPALNDLTDVTLTGSPATNDVLTYNGVEWVNAVTTAVVSELNDLTDVTLTGSPTLATNDVLTYDGTFWVHAPSGGASQSVLSDLIDVVTDGSPTLSSTDVLSYNGTNWVNVPKTSVGVTDHTLLTNVGTNTHAEIDTHIATGGSPGEDIHYLQSEISITESQISDLQDYALSSDVIIENGFTNRTDSTISFTGSPRTFTIAPAGSPAGYEYWSNGVKYTVTTSKDVSITNEQGIHAIYFDGATLVSEFSPTSADFEALIIPEYAFIAFVYWDVVSAQAVLVGEERHGRVMDAGTHLYLHRTVGTAYQTGLSMLGMTVDGDGSLDAHAEAGYTGGIIWDEDIKLDIDAVSAGSNIPILYMLGASAAWTKEDSVFVVLNTGTGRAAYNLDTAGTWTKAEVDNNNYTLTHYFATGEIDNPVVAIMGQSQYGNVSDARLGALVEITALVVSDMVALTPEFTAIATIIVQTTGTYTNTPQTRVRSTDTGDDYVDWREQVALSSGGASATEHNLLVGLQGGSITERYHLTSADAALVPTALQNINSESLNDLGDVVTSGSPTLTTGDLLLYNGVNWVANSTQYALSSDVIIENGFTNRTSSAISFVSGTRTFTIDTAGSPAQYEYWSNGTKYTETISKNVVIDNSEGIHAIYFNGSTLTAAYAPTATDFENLIIPEYAFVAFVYWSISSAAAVMIGDERHGRVMDSETHLYLHNTKGTAYQEGLSMIDMTTDGDGSLAAHAEAGYATGIVWDEDIKHELAGVAGGSNIPTLYRDGVGGNWLKQDSNFTVISFSGGFNLAAYNLDTAGTWSQVEVTHEWFVLTHYFATGDIDNPVIAVQGQTQYETAEEARNGAAVEINDLALGDLATLTPEFKAIATVINQTNIGYSNAVKTRTITTAQGADFVDWRNESTDGSSEARDHEALINPHNNWMSCDNNTDFSSTASGTGSSAIAIGSGSSAPGSNNVVIGTQANCSGVGGSTNGIAIGKGAYCKDGTSQLAVGDGAHVTGYNSTAIGFAAGVTGSYAVAIGYTIDNTNTNTVEIGTSNTNKMVFGTGGQLSLLGSNEQFVQPNFATASLPTGVLGGTVYDTTTSTLKVYTGTWDEIGGAVALNDLTDVVTDGSPTLAATDLLQYNGANWVNVATSSVGVTDHDLLTNNGGAGSHATITSHIADTTIHFTEGNIVHQNISGAGTNDHAAIDSHIGDTTVHFIEGNIVHQNISGAGTNTHTTIDSHLADTTIHFTEASIDHTAIANIGSNTHAQIDTFMSSPSPSNNWMSCDNNTDFATGASGTGANAIAIGHASNASGVNSIAIGHSAIATGYGGICIGDNTSYCRSADSIAIGPDARVGSGTTQHSICIGGGLIGGDSSNCILIGDGNTIGASNCRFSVALGNAIYPYGLNQVLIGIALPYSASYANETLLGQGYAIAQGTDENYLHLKDEGTLNLHGANAQFVAPNYTTGALPVGVTGGVTYDTTTNELKVFDGTWSAVGVGGSGATQLNELSDVNTSTPTNNFVLVADGVDFESRLLTLTDLSDVNTAAITNRFVLVADGVDYESRLLTELDISDLGTYMETLSDDAAPVLGGNLDVSGNAIVSISAGDIEITPDTTGQVVITNPDLASTSNADIELAPNGTGHTRITNLEAPQNFNPQAGTAYTGLIADAGQMITMSNTVANTFTIPANSAVAYPVGTVLHIQQINTGATTIGIDTDTLNVNANLTKVINGQWGVVTCMKMTATTWTVFGNLVAV